MQETVNFGLYACCQGLRSAHTPNLVEDKRTLYINLPGKFSCMSGENVHCDCLSLNDAHSHSSVPLFVSSLDQDPHTLRIISRKWIKIVPKDLHIALICLE